MFRKLPNISSSNIQQNLEKAGVDLSKSKFSDEYWHASSPSYDAIREELLTLDQYNKDPREKLLINKEIVLLVYQERINTSQLVLKPALETLKLMETHKTNHIENSSADNSNLTGEAEETY